MCTAAKFLRIAKMCLADKLVYWICRMSSKGSCVGQVATRGNQAVVGWGGGDRDKGEGEHEEDDDGDYADY